MGIYELNRQPGYVLTQRVNEPGFSFGEDLCPIHVAAHMGDSAQSFVEFAKLTVGKFSKVYGIRGSFLFFALDALECSRATLRRPTSTAISSTDGGLC